MTMRIDEQDKPLSGKAKLERILQRFSLKRLLGRGLSDENDLNRLIDEGEEEGIIEEEEHELIHNVFDFGETIVREVMVPRVDITAAPLRADLNSVLDLIIQKGHSRIPIYDQKMDNIVGIIYAKDLLKILRHGEKDIDFARIMRPPYFVPETKKIMDLLKEFQLKKIHMAIVVDEYGGTAGLVTIEDLLEELVGEIQDEYDNEEEMLKRLDENSISVDAQIPIEDIEEFFDCEIPKEDFETVGGLLFHIFERIPKEGEETVFRGLRFTVKKADARRLWRVEISKALDEKDLT